MSEIQRKFMRHVKLTFPRVGLASASLLIGILSLGLSTKFAD